MSDVKQVKVDNWGIYFLQRLKHFFNRTDYCDLTLQFQDNAQLKVHRLVLSACTEYFELLERTCEMYEDCLVMPDDLQADVVVPIVNFMYTGQLEFRMELLERLYQTSLVMNMPVLTKLLYAHRQQSKSQMQVYNKPIAPKASYSSTKAPTPSSSGLNNKRTFSKAFEPSSASKSKKIFYSSTNKPDTSLNNSIHSDQSFSSYNFPVINNKNINSTSGSRPTRYELPEELDEDNIFDNSFTKISYTSKPLMIHPKQYSSKPSALFEDASTSKRFFQSSSADIVECKKISSSTNSQQTNIFEDEIPESLPDESDMFPNPINQKGDPKNASQLFDQILDSDVSKLTFDTSELTNDNSQTKKINHAKIISEVLKKYPHLVKSNKSIKLKILNTPKTKKKQSNILSNEEPQVKLKQEPPDFTYESDVIDSKRAAVLIGLGAENVKGPWICLICGTPGKALHFTSYYKYRRHLVEVHNEKPIPNMCEYCGLKSLKRNCLLYHLYRKHGIPPPSNYNFPKCNYCSYIALTEALLVKHKMTHSENRLFRCNVCASTYLTSNELLAHIQKTGHKYSDKKTNLQCIYCLKVFLREANLYAHLKTNHKTNAKEDGIIDDSDEDNGMENVTPSQITDISKQESPRTTKNSTNLVKSEVPISYDNAYEERNVQYQIEQKSDGKVQIISKKPKVLMPVNQHKILNSGFSSPTHTVTSPSNTLHKKKSIVEPSSEQSEFLQEIDSNSPNPSNNSEEIVIIDNQEFIIQNYQLVPKREINTEEYVIPHSMLDMPASIPSSSHVDYETFNNTQHETAKVMEKKSTNINQPIRIVVSNEEEYKALMNSNHSIIFDNTDANKTLTVLAGPNNTQLETESIDLDNTQTSNMMIIPENYPINVSESVAADSSNIVVVYSHPVDDQNKQYQIITSQGLDAQFVQPSTIITQNYETVTTCSSDINAHNMINTQVVGSWQNVIQGNITKLPIQENTNSAIRSLHIPTSMEVTSIGNLTTNNVEELPEVTLSQQPQTSSINITQIVTSQSDPSVNLYNQPHILEQSVIEPNDNTITHDISLTNQHQTVTPLNLLDQAVVTTEVQTHDNVVVDQGNTIIVTDSAIDSSSMTQKMIVFKDNTNESELNMTTDSVIVSNEQTITSHVDNSIHNINELNENSLPDSNVNIDTNSSIELITQNPIPEQIHENTTNNERANEQIPEEVSNQDNLVESQNETEPPEITEIISKESDVYPQSISEVVQNTDIINDNVDVINDGKSIVNENVESVIISNAPADKEIKENIITLASEWSEDESDVPPEMINSHNDSQDTEITKDGDKSDEIEESIENIQKEIEKQATLNKPVETNKKTISNEPITNQESVTALNEGIPQANDELKQASQEKISSLLNDWDENDSQEESGNGESATNITIDENEVVETNNESAENNNCSVIVEPEPKKDDKIKSLVSDWDEEDEEETKDCSETI